MLIHFNHALLQQRSVGVPSTAGSFLHIQNWALAFHQLATCSVYSVWSQTQPETLLFLHLLPLCISRVSGCQQTGTPSSHHVLRRSPSHPSQMVKVRYLKEEQFSKGHTVVGEDPWGTGYPSHQAHLPPSQLSYWLSSEEIQSSGTGKTGCSIWG